MSRIMFSRLFHFCQSDSETEGTLYILVVNVDVHSRGLNVNVNRFENDNVWNAEYAHRVVSPQLCYFSLICFGGVFISSPFFQPPSIRPISSSCSDKEEYLALGRHLFSQASCRKNLRLSSFKIAIDNCADFLSFDK